MLLKQGKQESGPPNPRFIHESPSCRVTALGKLLCGGNKPQSDLQKFASI